MEENKNTPQQPNNNNNQKEPDKNKTLNDPGADVIDYGRSEGKAIKESNQDREQGSENDSERKQH